jgi:hypothetical protein
MKVTGLNLGLAELSLTERAGFGDIISTAWMPASAGMTNYDMMFFFLAIAAQEVHIVNGRVFKASELPD